MDEAWRRSVVWIVVVVTLIGLSSVWAGISQHVELPHHEDRHGGGGCASSRGKLCCQGKNNTCRVDGPRAANSDSFTCFCDSSCTELGDCCADYKTTCQRQ